jgi:hypothetical protein
LRCFRNTYGDRSPSKFSLQLLESWVHKTMENYIA